MSNLKIEYGRHTQPVTPVSARLCLYCNSKSVDDEKHAILSCSTFNLKRNCFFGKISSIIPFFLELTLDEKLMVILCPSSPEIALCVSKYLGIITNTRKKLDQGLSADMLNVYCKI